MENPPPQSSELDEEEEPQNQQLLEENMFVDESGDSIAVLTGHSDSIYCLEFLSNGKFLFSGSGDESVIKWDIQQAFNIVHDPDPLTNKANQIKTSPEMSTEDNIKMALANLEKQKQASAHSSKPQPTENSKAINVDPVSGSSSTKTDQNVQSFPTPVGITTSPGEKESNSQSLTNNTDDDNNDEDSLSNQSLPPVHYVVDLDPFKTLKEAKDTIIDIKFNFDKTLFAVASYDSYVRIYNVFDDKLVATCEANDSLEWIQFHPKANLLIGGCQDGSITLWSSKGTILRVYVSSSFELPCGGFSNDGKFILSGSNDACFRVWAPKGGNILHTFKNGYGFHSVVDDFGGILSMACSPFQSDIIVTGGADSFIYIINITTHKILGCLKGHTEGVEHLLFSEDVVIGNSEIFCSGSTDGNVFVWNMTKQQLRCKLVHPNSVTQMAFSKRFPWKLYTTCSDCITRMWDIRSGKCLREWKGPNKIPLALSCAVMQGGPDRSLIEEWIAVGGDDTKIHIFSENYPPLRPDQADN